VTKAEGEMMYRRNNDWRNIRLMADRNDEVNSSVTRPYFLMTNVCYSSMMSVVAWTVGYCEE